MSPLVSIVCFTYNHEEFINDALASFVMQQVNFTYEIIVHDDASTDNTPDIIREYTHSSPQLFKPIFQKENQASQEKGRVSRIAYKAAKGKYIALCEGDDYWTDPLKLQKQVDFLEANPEFSLCFHDAIIVWDNKSNPPNYFCSSKQKDISFIEDIIKNWSIPTASMVFRREAILPALPWLKNVYNGDLMLQMILADKGKIRYLDEVMSVYRKSTGNLSSTMDVNYIQKQVIHTLSVFNEYSNGKYEAMINMRIAKIKKKYAHSFLSVRNLYNKYFRLITVNRFLRKIGFHVVQIK